MKSQKSLSSSSDRWMAVYYRATLSKKVWPIRDNRKMAIGSSNSSGLSAPHRPARLYYMIYCTHIRNIMCERGQAAT